MNRYALFKVNEGKLLLWKEWCLALETRLRAHALETLQFENSNRECYVLFTVEGVHYVMGASQFFAEPKKADMTDPLNIEHRKVFDECLTFVCSGESLCDLSVDK